MKAIARMESKVAGYFKLEKHSLDECGNVIPGSEQVVGWFPNLITNSGLDLLATGGFLQRCFLGTSNTPPSFTDTALGAQVGFQNVTSGPAVGPSGADYVSSVATYTFGQGAVTGNIQEIGIGTTTNQLLSRALIVDGNGDPTVLVLTSIDVLTVTYQFREYPSQADIVDTITDGATTYTVTTRTANGLRAARVNMWNTHGVQATSQNLYTYTGGLGPWTGTPSGPSGTQSGGRTVAAYTPGSYYRDFSFLMTTAQGNASGGIAAVLCDNPGGATEPAGIFQASFSPKIAKDNTKTLQITFRFSWGRYSP